MSNHSDSENSDGFVITDKPDQPPAEASPLSTEELSEVRKWLEPTAYDIAGGEYRKHSASYLAGTGSWLTASPEYQQWLTSRDRGLLWVKGIPGSGKSVMAAKIITELTAAEPKSPVLYFFFRQIIDANHEPAALLRDWMDQLLQHSPVLQRQLYSYVQDLRSVESVSLDEMWKKLKMGFSSLKERIFCITDALDEMDQGNDEFLKALASLGQWQPDKLKILITSRPVPSVEEPLHLTPCLKIRLREDQVDRDISLFVQHSLERSQIDKQFWSAITRAVPGRANGLFLYARLAMDAFLEPGVNIESALAHLPTDLNVLYTNFLKEHVARSGVDNGIQRVILQAVTHATRPLRLLEIAELIGVVDGNKDLKARKELVKAACGPLLEILADETVSVIHHSFTEYLKGMTRSKNDPGYPVLNSGAAHEQLGMICLRYLQGGSLANFPASFLEENAPRRITDTKVAFWQRHPFLKYAAGNWPKHVVAACSASSDDTKLCSEISKFLENDYLRQVWCRLYWQNRSWTASKAHIAATLDLAGYIKELVRRDEDLETLDEWMRTPICWAAAEDCTDAVQVLIAAGVKLDLTDVNGDSPLHKAAEKNHASVTRLLLEAGVSPLLRKGLGTVSNHFAHVTPSHGDSPLRYACERGHWEVLDEMLIYVTSIKDVHWALAWATFQGHSRLVARILKYPRVDINARLHGNTFLYLSCISTDFETINMILQAGADVKALSEGSCTPTAVDVDYTPEPTGSPTKSCLSGLFSGYHTETIFNDPIKASKFKDLFNLLLAAGFDINQRDEAGQTILHKATKSTEVVRALISAGANAKAVDHRKNTALHLITNPEVISILVKEGGADLDAINDQGKTPLHCAANNSQDSILKLLEVGSNCNALDYEGNGPLHVLLTLSKYHRSLEHISSLLRFGADPNLVNNQGLSALRCIKYLDHDKEAAIFLIEAGADVDSKDKDGKTILFDVVGQVSHINRQRVNAVQFLLDAGASKDMRDHKGRTIGHEVIKGIKSHDIGMIVQWLDVMNNFELIDMKAVDNDGNGLLHELCFRSPSSHHDNGINTELMRMLNGMGLDLSQKNHAGHTPLHLLCARPYQYGGLGMTCDIPLVYAIRKSKNIDEIDANGNTALHVASVYEHSWCKFLLDAGADPTLRNHDGMTPLHLAARCKQSNTVGMLLKSIFERLGDDPSARPAVINAQVVPSTYNVYEPSRITPLFYACQSGRTESVKLLLDAGANPNIGNLFVACAMMEHENRMWDLKEPDVRSGIAALRLFDTTRPTIPDLDYQRDRSHSLADTRLEDILDMLVAGGIDLSLFYGSGTGQPNPLFKAAQLNSSYTYRCLYAIKVKHCTAVGEMPSQTTSDEALHSLCLLDQQMMVDCEDASARMMDKGWLKPDGVSPPIFRAIIIRRQYHLIKQMIDAGCRFLVPDMKNMHYLIAHGFTSLFDQIAQAETQAALSEGEWHAFGDATKPGLHFEARPNNEVNRFGEPRNALLKHAIKRPQHNLEIVQLLVDKYGVNVNDADTKNHNTTSLHIIARGRYWWQGVLALPVLLRAGANIESRNSAGKTPLHAALDKESIAGLGTLGAFHKDVAEALVKAGADVNAVDSKGQTCLDMAGYSVKLIDLLVGHGAVVRPSSIFAALKSENGVALEKLLQGGADANGRIPLTEDSLAEQRQRMGLSNDDGYLRGSRMTFDNGLIPGHELSPIYYIASKSAFPEQADARRCFKALVDNGADLYATFQAERGEDKWDLYYGKEYNQLLGLAGEDEGALEERSVLHELVRLGKLTQYLINTANVDASCLDAKGCNLLHAVCDSRSGPDRLLDTDTHEDDNDEDSDKKPEEITEFQKLLALGCDIRGRDNNGQSVVHYMIYRGWSRGNRLERLEKSVAEVARIAPELLDATNDSGNTPLHYSALLSTCARQTSRGCWPKQPEQTSPEQPLVDLSRLLLRHGASPAGINQDGNSVLHLMAHNLDHSDVVALFLELVRDHGLDVNGRNNKGETPLWIFADRVSVIARLKGEERTSLQLEEEEGGSEKAIAMLEAAGADYSITDDEGNGLLHLAAGDTVQLFKAIMERGKLDAKTENLAHQTAIDVAATHNNNEILALFEKKV